MRIILFYDMKNDNIKVRFGTVFLSFYPFVMTAFLTTRIKLSFFITSNKFNNLLKQDRTCKKKRKVKMHPI